MVDTEMEIFPENVKVVGIGKVIVSTDEKVDYNIPHLHFLVVKGFSEGGVYDALNLEYGIHCSASDPKEAFLINYKRVLEYFEMNEINSPEKFRGLLEEQDNHSLSDYWRVFRRTEMLLATEKKDLGSALIHDMRKEIEQDIEKLDTKVFELLENSSEQLSEITKKLDVTEKAMEEAKRILAEKGEKIRVLNSAQSLQYAELEAA